MKRILYILLLCLCTQLTLAQNPGPEPVRTGYTTKYGYGFNTTRTCDYPVRSIDNTKYNYNYSYPYKSGSKYNSNYSSGGSPKRGPRRIPVYNGDGGTENTPGGNSDNPNWLYEYDGTDWWCSQDGGVTWKKWDSWLGLGWMGFSWREGRGDPTEEAVHYHNDPTNPWVTPVGDPLFPTILLCLIYVLYRRRSNFLREIFYRGVLNYPDRSYIL